jgi:sigma-B regulation protein RsbU (phosphoserine phosphatase)
MVSHELRLAARLQQDFLPRRLPEIGQARFGALFRPAFWVSGDIYDIMRLDETHVGFYVIDAVGHGLAAALLTMFIRRALQTKRITGSEYHIFQPNQTLAELNVDICSEELSNAQFCTGVYCVLDVETMELTYARAGHPEPGLIRADGTIEALPADGPLLGVFPDGEFEARTVQLAPGDRVVLYTDGAEDALKQPSQDLGHGKTFARIAEDYRQTPRTEMLMQMTASLDIKYGLTDPEDDVTVVVMDLEQN